MILFPQETFSTKDDTLDPAYFAKRPTMMISSGGESVDLTDIYTQINKIKADIEDLKNNSGTTDPNINSKISTLETSISTLETSLNTIQDNITTLTTNFSTLNSSITTLTTSLTTLTTNIESLGDRIDILENTEHHREITQAAYNALPADVKASDIAFFING